jgi:hypothetical protein
MAKKSAAAKKRARQKKKANVSLPKPRTSEPSSSSEAETGVDRAQVKDSHSATGSVTSALGSLQVRTGKGASGLPQSIILC